MTLDDAFALLDTLAQQADAFTTGTANNQALASYALAMAVTLATAAASADTALAAARLDSPAGVLAAVSAAGNAACCRAAAAELTNLQEVLSRL